MDIFKKIVNVFNLLTGRTLRHNRALRNTRDWATTVQEFLSEYQLGDNLNISFLLKNPSQADFDLVTLAHNGNLLIKPALKIRDRQVLPHLIEVINDIVSMRRALMSPALRSTRLPEVVSRLCASYEKFQERLSAIEYI